jgi:hypothetical protein
MNPRAARHGASQAAPGTAVTGDRSPDDMPSPLTLRGQCSIPATCTLPPLCAATWLPRRLARAAPNWMFCVR